MKTPLATIALFLAAFPGCAVDDLETGPDCTEGTCDERNAECDWETHPNTLVMARVTGPRSRGVGGATVSVTTECGTFSREADPLSDDVTFPIMWTHQEAPNGRYDAVFEIVHQGNSFSVSDRIYPGEDIRVQLVLPFEDPCLEADYSYQACQMDTPAEFSTRCADEPTTAQSVLDVSCGELQFGPEYAADYGKDCSGFLSSCADGLVCRPTRIKQTPVKSDTEYCLPPAQIEEGCSENDDCAGELECVADLFCS